MVARSASLLRYHRFVGEWIDFEIGRDDVRRFARFIYSRHQRRLHKGKPLRLLLRLLLVLTVVLVSLLVVLAAFDGGVGRIAGLADVPLLRTLVPVALMLGALVLVMKYSFPHIATWQAQRSKHAMGPRRVRLGEDGMHLVANHSTSVIAWSGIDSVEESGDDLMVMLSQFAGLIIPGHAFETGADRARFLARARDYLA